MKNVLKDFIDEHNRLVFSEKDGGVSVETILGDTFGGKKPEKKVVEGRWSVTSDHDLKIRLSGSDSRFRGRTIIFRGEVIKADSSGLFFRIRHCDALSGLRSQTIQLRGEWVVDRRNRLTFQAAKASGLYNILRFNGTWNIGPNNELSYRFVRTEMKTRTKEEEIVIFRGHWDIYPARIVYRLEGSTTRGLSIKAAIQSRSIRAKEGAIRYRLGAGYSDAAGSMAGRAGILTLHGLWRLGHDLHVIFELRSPGRKNQRIRFGIEKLKLRGGDMTVSLISDKGRALGIDVTFSRAVTKNTELFISGGYSSDEKRIMGGIRGRF